MWWRCQDCRFSAYLPTRGSSLVISQQDGLVGTVDRQSDELWHTVVRLAKELTPGAIDDRFDPTRRSIVRSRAFDRWTDPAPDGSQFRTGTPGGLRCPACGGSLRIHNDVMSGELIELTVPFVTHESWSSQIAARGRDEIEAEMTSWMELELAEVERRPVPTTYGSADPGLQAGIGRDPSTIDSEITVEVEGDMQRWWCEGCRTDMYLQTWLRDDHEVVTGDGRRLGRVDPTDPLLAAVQAAIDAQAPPHELVMGHRVFRSEILSQAFARRVDPAPDGTSYSFPVRQGLLCPLCHGRLIVHPSEVDAYPIGEEYGPHPFAILAVTSRTWQDESAAVGAEATRADLTDLVDEVFAEIVERERHRNRNPEV